MASRAGPAQKPNGTPQGKICQFKLVLLGESAVGKSSLVLRFVKGQFHEYQESTIGAAFLTQTVCLDDTTVKFEIWDTAGQERYHSLAPMYYRGAQAAIVVYDITNQDTFGRAKTWVKELQRQASPNIVIALAGNKADLSNKRMVELDEAKTYAEENGLLFMETSAKTAMNVNDIFLAIAKKLPKTEGGGLGVGAGKGKPNINIYNDGDGGGNPSAAGGMTSDIGSNLLLGSEHGQNIGGGGPGAMEGGNSCMPTPVSDRSALIAVLHFLRKNNLQHAEDALRKEAGFFDEHLDDRDGTGATSVWSAYKTENDPASYADTYVQLKKFVESALDVYKHELSMILYPAFAHMYLELVYNGHEKEASEFMANFGNQQEDYYKQDVAQLASVTLREHLRRNSILDGFKSSQFNVRMSRESYNLLKKFLDDKRHSLLLNIVQEHIYLDVYEGVPRNKTQIDATAGAMTGEAIHEANKAKILYGLLKEPDLQIPLEEDDEGGGPGGGGEEKMKKKKGKKDPLLSRKMKNDPNAPPNNRLPLPDLRDIDKLEKVRALRESMKRVTLGPENLPSICYYTFLNSSQRSHVTCIKICEDSSTLAVGFADSNIKVFSLMPQKLRAMKSAQELSQIDKDADDVYARMLDESSGETCRTLTGHSGAVFGVTFSPDRSFLLSCSEDSSIRLWSLLMWSCLVVYKGHIFPVWDVKFCPHGYYFATASHDKTACLWATDHHQPLRIFGGHLADIDVLEFHPNSNYLATGSSDRCLRLWDCVTGSCVRIMTGHKGPVHCLAFSVDGRFLASGGMDLSILIWDIAHGHLLAELAGHTGTLYSLAFSRDGHILASGGIDFQVKLWDFARLTEEVSLEDVNVTHNPEIKSNTSALLLGSYPTKSTSVLELHFTRRNLLLGAGFFET